MEWHVVEGSKGENDAGVSCRRAWMVSIECKAMQREMRTYEVWYECENVLVRSWQAWCDSCAITVAIGQGHLFSLHNEAREVLGLN